MSFNFHLLILLFSTLWWGVPQEDLGSNTGFYQSAIFKMPNTGQISGTSHKAPDGWVLVSPGIEVFADKEGKKKLSTIPNWRMEYPNSEANNVGQEFHIYIEPTQLYSSKPYYRVQAIMLRKR